MRTATELLGSQQPIQAQGAPIILVRPNWCVNNQYAFYHVDYYPAQTLTETEWNAADSFSIAYLLARMR
jgi:hypothetical protein